MQSFNQPEFLNQFESSMAIGTCSLFLGVDCFCADSLARFHSMYAAFPSNTSSDVPYGSHENT